MPDTITAPLHVRSVADINNAQTRIEWFAARTADAIAQALDDRAEPASFTSSEAARLVRDVVAAVLIDEPGVGDAVDITSNQFQSALTARLAEQGING